MYTGPVALMSLIVFLPVFAGVAALVHSTMQSAAVELRNAMREEIARMAAKIIASEIEHNETLLNKAITGGLSQQDLEYLVGKASEEIGRVYGVNPTINLKIAVYNESLVKEQFGFDMELTLLYNATLVQRPSKAWAVETIVVSEVNNSVQVTRYYVLVQAGY